MFGRERATKGENVEHENVGQAVWILTAPGHPAPIPCLLRSFCVSKSVLPPELPLLVLLVIIYSFGQQNVGCRDGSISVQVFDFCSTL